MPSGMTGEKENIPPGTAGHSMKILHLMLNYHIIRLWKDGLRLGFEFKYSDKPQLTKAMTTALDTLQLNSLTIISPGTHDFPLADKVRAIGLGAYINYIVKTP